jgi:hypothetical protein
MMAIHVLPPYARLDAALRESETKQAALAEENSALTTRATELRQKCAALEVEARASRLAEGTNLNGLQEVEFRYGIDTHWCDASGIYVEGWIQHEHAPIEGLTLIAGSHRCEMKTFLPHTGLPTRLGRPPKHGASAFAAYVAWRASDVLYFEAQVGSTKTRFPVDLPPGRIASGPWSHAQSAAPQVDIFGRDEFGRAFQTMIDEVNSHHLSVYEVGSRNVSPGATSKRTTFSGAPKFIGVDVHMADNVDIVGDAHYLHELVGEAGVDGVFSIAVLEHLSYPWLFAASVNRALRLGGLTFHLTHQTWPIHEEPNDFWRFSDSAMRVLFGSEMGFETISAGMYNRTFLYPEERREAFGTLPLAVAYSHVFVLARKIRNIDPNAVRWPVAKEDAMALANLYPRLL